MDFTKLQADHSCNCLENANEETDNLYAIKTMKDVLRVQDFNSYWDKGRRPKNDDCTEICSLKGISLSIINEDTKDAVIETYKELFPLAPKYKPYLSIIKLYETSGMVKHTPIDLNQYHFDFYKSDAFDFTKVNLINVNELH